MTPDREHKVSSVLHRRQFDIAVVMENIEDPRNIAAVMRSCDAVGIQNIYVLNTLQQQRLRKWSFASSRSAEKWVTLHHFDDVTKCVEALRKQYDHIYTTHLSTDAVSIYDVDFTKKAAIVFGNERVGISPEMLASANANCKVPQVGMVQSLNISVACAVTIYEAYRQRMQAGLYEQSTVNSKTLMELGSQWKLL